MFVHCCSESRNFKTREVELKLNSRDHYEWASKCGLLFEGEITRVSMYTEYTKPILYSSIDSKYIGEKIYIDCNDLFDNYCEKAQCVGLDEG